MKALEMTEAEFQTQVLRYCDLRSVLAYHVHDSRRSQPGFPDLTLVGDRGLLFVELKKEDRKSKPTTEQLMWADALTAADQHWQLWRPSMWDAICIPQINALGRCSALVAHKQEQAEIKARAMLASRNARLRRE